MSAVVRARDGALERVREASLWVLDIDGVLLDPKPSFYRAAMETAEWAAARALGRPLSRRLRETDVAAFKGAGGWNDDFDLAVGLAWALLEEEQDGEGVETTGAVSAGGLPTLIARLSSRLSAESKELCETSLVRRRCAARYAGRSRCFGMYGIDPDEFEGLEEEGLWPVESILCSADSLRSLPRPLAFFTGRNAAEAEIAAERLGLDVPLHRRVVDDGSCAKKPAPDGLHRLSAHTGGLMLFVGDSIDDQRAALAYANERGAKAPVLFARVIGDGALHHSAEDALAEGADLVVSGLDSLMQLVLKEGT